MPVLKVMKNGVWETLNGNVYGDADTLDGKHASDFATKEDILVVNEKIANMTPGKTLSDHLEEEFMILTQLQYGDTLPGEGEEEYVHVPGRIFFKRVKT